jgi:hypothetical protein
MYGVFAQTYVGRRIKSKHERNVTDRHTISRIVFDESERNGQLIDAEIVDFISRWIIENYLHMS